MQTVLDTLRAELVAHPSNAWARELGWQPLYAAAPGARVVVVGQAPGRKAQASGVPWDDASGVRLRAWLGVPDEVFYDPARFAILPMDFWYPGKGTSGDLPPRPDFAPLWHHRILAELPDVRLMVLVGAYAQRYYLGARARGTLTETVRAWAEYLPDALPLVHPSPLNFRWLTRNPWFEQEVVPALRTRVAEALGEG